MPVDDLWFLKTKGPDGKPLPSQRHGRGRRWRVRYTDPDGNAKVELFEKKAAADAYDLEVRSKVQRGEYVDPTAGKITLETYAKQWLEVQTFDDATRVQVEGRLRAQVYPTLGPKELGLLAQRPSVIQAWVRGLQATLAPSYVRIIFTNLSSIMLAAVDDGLINRNPCRATSIKLPAQSRRKVQPWGADRVLAVRDGLPAAMQVAVDIGHGAGLRQGEMFAFAVEDVDWLRRMIHVRRQVKVVRGKAFFAPPKRGKDRDVPLSTELSLRLSARLQATPAVAVTLPWGSPAGKPVTVNLFLARLGEQLSVDVFNRAWVTALLSAGVIQSREDVTRDKMFHQLRHAFASALLAEGVDIRALAEYLGHSDPGFTLRTYTHLMPTSEDKARQAIDRALTGETRSSGTDSVQAAAPSDHGLLPTTTSHVALLSRA